MAGAHTARSGGGTAPGVGWWQTPKKRVAIAARHRAVGATEPIPVLDPRDQRPVRTRAARVRTARRVALRVLAAILVAPVLAFVVGYLILTVPSPDDAVNNQVAVVSFADGSALTRLVPEEGNRTKVPIDAVPGHVRDAVLAAEDRSFYSNPGFDVTGILRATWNQVRGGSGGGSTITQQFVKKALVGDAQTLWRKYKEVVLAVKISRERSKDQILGDYLNTIYFGRGAYGIQSAAQAYFATPVGELTATEGALLAGLIQSPSRWDPAISPDRATERWNFVLDGMVAQGTLDPAARRAAQFPAVQPRRAGSGGVPDDHRGHIVTAVRAELEELGISEQDLAQGGLRITTTVDPRRQQEAVDAARRVLTGEPADLRAATVAVDPATGGVLAYYGGENGLGLDYARTRRLSGSTFKPFVVLAGLLRDPPVGLGETFDGAELPGLRNAAGADCDRCDLKEAMTVSNNVVFSSLARRVGPESVADAARAAGITAPLDDPNPGIALGNKEVSALELASAYATIAAGGVWRQPHVLASVVTAEGDVLYEAATGGERRFPERVARNVTEAMLDVAGRDGLALPGGRPVAAKTGTVQSRVEGENNDAWMAGFTPMVAVSVWMGTDLNSPIRTAEGTPISGSSLPGAVWREFMARAHDAAPVQEFAPFRPIGLAPAGSEVSDGDGTVPTAAVAPTPDLDPGPLLLPGGPGSGPVDPARIPDPGPPEITGTGTDLAEPGADPDVADPGGAAAGAAAADVDPPAPAPGGTGPEADEPGAVLPGAPGPGVAGPAAPDAAPSGPAAPAGPRPAPDCAANPCG